MRSERPATPTTSLWVAGSAVVTVAMYLLTLGWHAVKATSPDGRCLGTGPYEAWQVVVLGIELALVVGCATWQRRGWPVALTCAITLTIIWAADAATVNDPCMEGGNLWPVGAVLLLLGSAVGLGVVATMADWSRAVVERRRSR